MIRVKTLVGVCAICALAVCAVGAQSASAVGTTGFTCKEKKEPGGAGFSDAHCTSEVATGAKFEHVAIPEGVKTEGRTTNERTAAGTTASEPSKLVAAIAGVQVELKATSMVGEASGTNKKTAEGEMFIEGTGKTTYLGVTVVKPAGKSCVVKEGKITTEELRATSLGQGMEGKLEAVGKQFANVTIEKCTVAALNNTFPVTGSIKCPNVGVTVVCSAAATTAQETLLIGGNEAGIEGAGTGTARANSTEPFTPVTATTVP
jgi:hypothetical protein